MNNTPQNPPAGMSAEQSLDNQLDPESPAAGAPEGPKPLHPDDVIARMRIEIADLKDKFLRAQAEVENIRKRTEREKEETAKYAITKFARDIVSASDNFQRAISAVPAGAAEQDPALKTLIEGVTMSEREFANVMERHGIKRLEPKGEIFNPHQHQAMMETEDPAVPAGTILQVFQTGYTIEDRVLRPALVVVAKGGAKPLKQGNNTGANETVAAPTTAENQQSPPSGADGGNPTQS